MRPLTPATELLSRRRTGPSTTELRGIVAAGGDASGIPELILDRLADLALLQGVPFEYLVPDARLLPPESIRFFELEPAWIDALRDGVLSVGEHSSADVALRLATLVPPPIERLASVRARRRGLTPEAILAQRGVTSLSSALVSGLLLRSTLVSDYPGLQLRAFDSTAAGAAPLALLRVDRPAQGVLLALFGGALAAVTIEEPHHGIRLGIEAGTNGAQLPLRGSDGRLLGATVAAPMRAGSPSGVVDVAELARRISQAGQPGVPSPVGASVLALQLLQPLVRQRFVKAAP